MEVIIYSTPTCGACKSALNYFADNGIEYEKIDVSADPEALEEMVDASGQMGVPVILVGGQVLVGWNLREFKEAYGRDEDGGEGEPDSDEGSGDGEVEGV